MVRLRAAQGLLAAKDKASIPALIALLGDSPDELAWQAEELLRYAAGPRSPNFFVGRGDAKQRKSCHDAWIRWWSEKGPFLDLGDAERHHRRPGLVLVRGTSVPPDTEGYVDYYFWLTGCDGTVRWRMLQPRDADISRLTHDAVRIRHENRIATVYDRMPPLYFSSRNHVRDGNHLMFIEAVTPPLYWIALDCNLLTVGGNRVIELDEAGRVAWAAFFPEPLSAACMTSEMIRLGFDPKNDAQFNLANTLGYRLRCALSPDPKLRNQTFEWLTVNAQSRFPAELLGGWLCPQIKSANSGNARQIADEVQTKSLPELMRLTYHPDAIIRTDAANQLWLFPYEASGITPRLLELLKDRDHIVRNYAAWALGAMRSESRSAVPALTSRLHDSDEHVRYTACRALTSASPTLGVGDSRVVARPVRASPAARGGRSSVNNRSLRRSHNSNAPCRD